MWRWRRRIRANLPLNGPRGAFCAGTSAACALNPTGRHVRQSADWLWTGRSWHGRPPFGTTPSCGGKTPCPGGCRSRKSSVDTSRPHGRPKRPPSTPSRRPPLWERSPGRYSSTRRRTRAPCSSWRCWRWSSPFSRRGWPPAPPCCPALSLLTSPPPICRTNRKFAILNCILQS